MVITYNDKGGVYKEHSDKSFNITVKYPFDYNNETAVYTDEDEPLTSFNFDPAIKVCAQLFVGVVIVAGLLAIAMLLISCAIHRDERVANKVSVAVSENFALFDLSSPRLNRRVGSPNLGFHASRICFFSSCPCRRDFSVSCLCSLVLFPPTLLRSTAKLQFIILCFLPKIELTLNCSQVIYKGTQVASRENYKSDTERNQLQRGKLSKAADGSTL